MRRGFTLVELMVVVAIVAILAALMFGVTNANLYGASPQRAADSIAANLNAVRTRALQTREIQQVQFRMDLTTPVIDVYTASKTGMAYTNFSSNPIQGVLRLSISNGITLQAVSAGVVAAGANPMKGSTEVDVTFYPDGSAYVGAAGGATIYLTDSHDNKYRVWVYHTTGSAYVRQGW